MDSFSVDFYTKGYFHKKRVPKVQAKKLAVSVFLPSSPTLSATSPLPHPVTHQSLADTIFTILHSLIQQMFTECCTLLGAQDTSMNQIQSSALIEQTFQQGEMVNNGYNKSLYRMIEGEKCHEKWQSRIRWGRISEVLGVHRRPYEVVAFEQSSEGGKVNLWIMPSRHMEEPAMIQKWECTWHILGIERMAEMWKGAEVEQSGEEWEVRSER